MKTIGILGGMSVESTLIYYRHLAELDRSSRGGLHSPELLIRSLDFKTVEELQKAGDWMSAGQLLNVEAKALAQCGADLIILATNTMHIVASALVKDLNVPFLHIADATAQSIVAAGHRKPGLMATDYTMTQSFYTDRLRHAGLQPVLPDGTDRECIHRIIFEELCHGIVTEESRSKYVQISEHLKGAGADSLILGCTEVCMLLNPSNVTIPVLDTTQIHCAAAYRLATSG